MLKKFIPFIAFFALLILVIPNPFNFATSVVPGWHTTIFPPYFIWTIIVAIILLFVTIGYWLLSRKVGKINWTLFAIHFVLTIPSLVFIKLPWIFLDFKGSSNEESLTEVSWRIKLIPVSWTLFVIAQMVFLIYYIRIISTKHAADIKATANNA